MVETCHVHYIDQCSAAHDCHHIDFSVTDLVVLSNGHTITGDYHLLFLYY